MFLSRPRRPPPLCLDFQRGDCRYGSRCSTLDFSSNLITLLVFVESFHTTPTAEETAHARETADGTAATRGHAPDPPGAPILQEDAALVRAGAAIKAPDFSFSQPSCKS